MVSTLAERVTLMLKGLNITKAEFARRVGVTPNYIYLLASGKVKSCSKTLALLIEEKFGYPAGWIMTGETESETVKEIVDKQIKDMNDDELQALATYLTNTKRRGDT